MFIMIVKTNTTFAFQAVSIITQKIMSAIMYILGHQQRDVSEWAKCRKLITHHLMKEMKMIDVRSLKVHKVCLHISSYRPWVW